jgi:hypothetical protein
LSAFPIKVFAELPLGFLLQILESLGSRVLGERGVSEDEEGLAICEAGRALADWPQGFHRALDLLGRRLSSERHSADGRRKQLDAFYRVMCTNQAFSGHASFLRVEFLKFEKLHWGTGSR